MSTRYDLELITKAIVISKTFREAGRKTGITGTTIKRIADDYGIDYRHFSWFQVTETVFIDRSGQPGAKYRHAFVKAFIIKNDIIPYRCKCGNEGVWEGRELVLDLDHINGNPLDDRIENLRFLCPNCHSQSDTFKGRNIKR